jgi:NADH:ubiquinone oxidoreductase subunit F (NADH-binding)
MRNPGLYELPFGTPIRLLFERCGGGLKDGRGVKAMLPGGPSCSFLGGDQLDVHLDPDSLKRAGSSLGCGVMRFFAEGTCMVEPALEIAQFFAKECCGQCPACRMETGMLSVLTSKIAAGAGDVNLYDQFQKIVDFNRGKGFCALINMPGPPLQSALRLFREDFDHHLKHGACAPSH